MTASMAPILWHWNGEAMVPHVRFQKLCDAQLVVGQTYRMEVVEERSTNSHRHEFAWLRTAWENLPEKIADLYPSVEHLRKRALIEAGYYTEEIIDAGTAAAALRVAAYVRGKDEFAAVIVRGVAVIVRTAKSQSYRAMNRKEFQESKDAVLEVVANLTGVTPEQLQAEQGKAA